MEDTGWWVPNYDLAEAIFGWKGKGCFSFSDYLRHYNKNGKACSVETTEIVKII